MVWPAGKPADSSMTAMGAIIGGQQPRRVASMGMFALVCAYVSLLFASYLIGVWLIDPSGYPIPTDFLNVWAAGRLVLQHAPADAYDWTIHKAVEVLGVRREFADYFGWHYPPPFLLVAAALALLPYPAAMVTWMAVSLPLYLASMRQIAGRRDVVLAALAWPAVFWNTVVGQNGFLTAALLGSGLALIERRPALAGILIGLLTYKPQFGLLIPIALIAGRHWRVLGWASASALGLALLSAVVLGTEPWLAFLHSTAHTNEAILVSGLAQFSKLQSLFGQMRALGASVEMAWAAHGFLVLALAGTVAWLWARRANFDTRASFLATATLLASPYIYLYDLVALAIPLAFLGRQGFSRHETVVVLIVGALVLWGPDKHVPTGFVAMLLVLCLSLLRARQARADHWRPENSAARI